MEVLVNKCYGGFNISEDVYTEYLCQKRKYDPEFHVIKDYVCRTDPILINIIKEFKTQNKPINEKYSRIKIVTIDKKYKSCFSIPDYDGMESISINKYKYKLKQIQTIIKSDIYIQQREIVTN